MANGRLKRAIFRSTGFGPVTKNRRDSKESDLPYTTFALVFIAKPSNRVLARFHPRLKKRLVKDWGERLSWGECSTGDFGKALRAGDVSLGHAWAELYTLSLALVAALLGYTGNVHESFREVKSGELIDRNPNETVYRVRMYFQERLPEEIAGIEHIVTGYLNNAMIGKEFNILQRLKDYIRHRSTVSKLT